MADVAAILKQAGYAKVPSRRAPNVAVRLMSLFDRQAKGMLPLLGKRIAFDTTATSDVLDWQPTPMEASFKEMAESLSE
jgi:dihydroflavonol-4-reductase